MKILYSVGSFISENHQLKYFLQNIDKKHIIKTAGHQFNTQSITNIDWNLSALALQQRYAETLLSGPRSKKKEVAELLNGRELHRIDIDVLKQLIADIIEFNPDLIITDGDPNISAIAYAYDIKLWNVGASYLTGQLNIENNNSPFYQYNYGLMKWRWFWEKRKINGERNYLPSIFANINITDFQPDKNCNWCSPYISDLVGEEKIEDYGIAIISNEQRAQILEPILEALDFKALLFTSEEQEGCRDAYSKARWLLTCGETHLLGAAIRDKKNICITPAISDTEQIVNAVLCAKLKIAHNVEQVEYMKKDAVDIFNKSYQQETIKVEYKKQHLYLHEEINNVK